MLRAEQEELVSDSKNFVIDNASLLLSRLLKQYKTQATSSTTFCHPISLQSKQLINLLLTALQQPLAVDKQIRAVILLLNTHSDVLASNRELIALLSDFFSHHLKYCIYFSDVLSAILHIRKPFEQHLSDWISEACKKINTAYALVHIKNKPQDNEVEPYVLYLYKESYWLRSRFMFALQMASGEIIRVEAGNKITSLLNDGEEIDTLLPQHLAPYITSYIAPYVTNSTYEFSCFCKALADLKWIPSVNRDEVTLTLLQLLKLGCDDLQFEACEVIKNNKSFLPIEFHQDIIAALYRLLPQEASPLYHSVHIAACNALAVFMPELNQDYLKSLIDNLIMIIVDEHYDVDSHIQIQACKILTTLRPILSSSQIAALLGKLRAPKNNDLKKVLCDVFAKLLFLQPDELVTKEVLEALRQCLKDANLRNAAGTALCVLSPSTSDLPEIVVKILLEEFHSLRRCNANYKKLPVLDYVRLAVETLAFSSEQRMQLMMEWLKLLASLSFEVENEPNLNVLLDEFKNQLPAMPFTECADFFINGLTSVQNEFYPNIYLCLIALEDHIPVETWPLIFQLLLAKIPDTVDCPKQDTHIYSCITAFRLRKHMSSEMLVREESSLLRVLMRTNNEWVSPLSDQIPADKWRDNIENLLENLRHLVSPHSGQQVPNNEISALFEQAGFLCHCLPKIIDGKWLNNCVITPLINFLKIAPSRYHEYCVMMLFRLKELTAVEHQAAIVDILLSLHNSSSLSEMYVWGISIDDNIDWLKGAPSMLASCAERLLDEIELSSYSQQVSYLHKSLPYSSCEAMVRFAEVLAKYITAEKLEVLKHGLSLDQELIKHVASFKN